MPIEEFIITVYVLVCKTYDDVTNGTPIRHGGFEPKLSDEEVITMEVVGEFLGHDTDKSIWRYFKRHWNGWFPNLGSRANFAKQAANLYGVKQKIHEALVIKGGGFSDTVHMVDGFPMPVCKITRAKRSKIFKGDASYGYCAAKDEKYYGLHGHVIFSFSGLITSITVTAANASERESLWELVSPIKGLLIGDKGYIDKSLKEELHQYEDIQLETPLRKNMKDDREPKIVKMLMKVRRIIETVIGQLSERFHIEKVRARDLWHLGYIQKIIYQVK